MLNFCTLFDFDFLPYGLTLYESLKKYCKNFHLYIFAFDEKCYAILLKLKLPNVTVISLKELEDKRLRMVKPSRSRVEYCWTCTSSSILYILEKYNVEICTYLDADLYFFSSPKVLLDELGTNSVIITEHRYTHDRSNEFGRYCVQFVTFKNDKEGLKVLKWWRDKTINWCYARVEEGKFGDQKYLDDWTTRFKGVHVLQHLGGGVAPWNVQQYEITKKHQLFGTKKSSGRQFRVVFYHFCGLRFYQKDIIQLASRYDLSKQTINLLYKPYIQHLEAVRNNLKKIDPTIVFSYPQAPGEPEFFKWFIRNLKIEISHLIELFSFKTAISGHHLNNIYYKDKLIGKNFNKLD